MKATASPTKEGTRPTGRLNQIQALLDIRYLALITTIATYALIVLGGVVRATDSGLACPDWPLCHGQIVPPLESDILIEYSHRLASVSVGLLILSLAVLAWISHRRNRLLLIGTTTAVALVIGQAVVGGATVIQDLPSSLIALHLGNALALLALLIVMTAWAFKSTGGRYSRQVPSDTYKRSRWTRIPTSTTAAGLATLALILVGSYVSNEGAALVYSDWPLFNGRFVSSGGGLADLHYAHRVLAAAVGLLILTAVIQAWRTRQSPLVRHTMALALIIYIAQLFVGASNIWLELATSVRVAHMALAAAMWALLAISAISGYLQHGGQHSR